MADVLVVDDDEVAGRVVALLLQQHGHEAVCHRNGRDALSFLSTARPRLVLLDMLMPDMSGLELLRTIRADERLRDVPVVMYTAISDPETRQQAEALGARDYLVKGQSWDEVYPQIEKHMQ
jgi:CheY-like chemotaxis protein